MADSADALDGPCMSVAATTDCALAEPGGYQRDQAAQLLVLRRISELVSGQRIWNSPPTNTTSSELWNQRLRVTIRTRPTAARAGRAAPPAAPGRESRAAQTNRQRARRSRARSRCLRSSQSAA